ncbi:MAG: hypothetical protein Q4C54_04175 [Clostridia bacterium]|nr:hypothetical protein [Clostridia bacterium]
MIQVIAGKKGSGKTKRLIEFTNTTAKKADKNVVFIDDDKRLMYDIDRDVRFVDASEYHVQTPDMFLGFLCGMLSQNYDIGTIVIDAFMKLCKADMATTQPFFAMLEELCSKHNVDFVISMSEDPANLPDFVRTYIV